MPVRKEFLVTIICTLSAVAVQQTPSNMCSKEEKPTDCSFQIHGAAVNSCLIYPTSVCRFTNYDAAHPPKTLAHESEAPFSFGFQPYLYRDPHLTNKLFSALNFTLKTSSPDVVGFVFMLQQSVSQYNSCRIFDFRAARKAQRNVSISLYYDCYKHLEFDGTLQYNLTIRSLPNNEELRYTMVIEKSADAEEESSNNSNCTKDFIHVLLVNEGSLTKNRADVKYVSVPLSTNFTGKRVQLSSNTGFEKVASLAPSKTENVMTATFEDLRAGSYSITPQLDHWGSCKSWNSLEFILTQENGYNKPQWIFITIVCGVVAAAVLIIVLLGSLCYHLNKPSALGDILLEPIVLLLYSYDCPKHHDVVLKLASHLRAQCKVRVILDEWERVSDPKKWLFTVIEENNLIILVLSQGVYHKCMKDNKPEMKEQRPNQDLFTSAVTPLCQKLGSPGCITKLVKVIFEYSDRSVEPPCFKNHGPRTFLLPNQLTQFLCELHGKKPNYFPTKVYPRMPGDNIESSNEGKALLQAICNMQTYQKQNPDWFKDMLAESVDGCLPCQSSSNSSMALLHRSSVKVEMIDS